MVISLDFYETLKKEKIVAVVRENTYEQAKFAINKLIENGIKIIEITLTTPKAIELIYEFSLLSKKNELIIGAGTVITKEQTENSIKNGAQFLVSPHFSKKVFDVCSQRIPYIPGVFTPKEAINAFSDGKNKVLKLFPSNIISPKFVSSLKKPYPFLEFMPSGGVDLSNIKEWLEAGCIAVSVGGNLVSGQSDLEIKQNIKKYKSVIYEFNSKK